MDQVRPLIAEWHYDHASPRLVGLSSTDTIRWRPRADPVQKQVPGDRITQKRD